MRETLMVNVNHIDEMIKYDVRSIATCINLEKCSRYRLQHELGKLVAYHRVMYNLNCPSVNYVYTVLIHFAMMYERRFGKSRCNNG